MVYHLFHQLMLFILIISIIKMKIVNCCLLFYLRNLLLIFTIHLNYQIYPVNYYLLNLK